MSSEYFTSKCYGCTYYNGYFNWDNKDTGVNCELKVATTIHRGCSSFKPDDVANCMSCCFNPKSDEPEYVCKKNHIISYHNIMVGKMNIVKIFVSNEEYRTVSTQTKKGCFLSTAVCDNLGLDDNCKELQTLRKFRDEKLLSNSKYTYLVVHYYNISPKFLLRLNDNKNLSEYLYHHYILPIVDMIENNIDTECIITEYKKMLNYISNYNN